MSFCLNFRPVQPRTLPVVGGSQVVSRSQFSTTSSGCQGDHSPQENQGTRLPELSSMARRIAPNPYRQPLVHIQIKNQGLFSAQFHPNPPLNVSQSSFLVPTSSF